jgi:hypothetical protein
MHVHDGTIQPVAGGPRNKDLQHRVGRGAVVVDLQCQRHVRVAGSIERLPGFSQRRCGVAALDFDHREPAMHLRGHVRLDLGHLACGLVGLVEFSCRDQCRASTVATRGSAHGPLECRFPRTVQS